MINGQPVDLGTLRTPTLEQQLDMIQRVMLDAAGLKPGDRAELVTDLGARVLNGVGLTMIVTPNGGLMLVGVTGEDDADRRALIPWHSISRMGPA